MQQGAAIKSKVSGRLVVPIFIAAGFAASFAIPYFNLLNEYVQLILMHLGINIILALSLNLVNGYMGEFSVGHAGFMSAGAYIASVLTVKVFPAGTEDGLSPWQSLPAEPGQRYWA